MNNIPVLNIGIYRIAELADPIERLQATGRAYAAFAFQHPNQYRLLFMTPRPVFGAERRAIERGNPGEDVWIDWAPPQKSVEPMLDMQVRGPLAKPE